MALKIKSEFTGTIIGFNKSSLPLGKRSQADLDFIYKRAKERNIQSWLMMFEEEEITLSEEEIDWQKEQAFLEKQDKKNRKLKNQTS